MKGEKVHFIVKVIPLKFFWNSIRVSPEYGYLVRCVKIFVEIENECKAAWPCPRE